MDNRRDFIKKAALLTGSAGIMQVLPAALQRALAINPTYGSTWKDAEHVVLLMQENRSFDHCFGSLQGVRGFNDPRAIPLPNQLPVWLQSNAEGKTYTPFRLNIKDTKATWMHSLPHSWDNQVDARNNGKYDGWLEAKRPGKPYTDIPMTLGYYTREDIPFYYAMADAFTVCDQHFCSSLTGTTPNRLYFWTGALREDALSKARVRNSDTDYDQQAAWKTFPERLEEHGVSWKIYQNELSVGAGFEGEEDSWLSNFTDNPIEWFSQYNVKLSRGYIDFLQKAEGLIQLKIAALAEQQKTMAATETEKNVKVIKSLKDYLVVVSADKKVYTTEKYNSLTAFEKNIHDKAFTTNHQDADFHELTEMVYENNGQQEQMKIPKGDILHQFRQDVTDGKLPTVSWIVAPENFSDHPTSPWYGAWYISEVMDILTKNPEVWKKTIFIVTYDENDGCFDHVPPFVPAHSAKPETGATTGISTVDEFVTMEQELKEQEKEDRREGPIGLGFRVPMLIASPWSRGGQVCSEVFDHTSPLQFLEAFISEKTSKPIKETNISQWRRTVCGNLTSAFKPYNGEAIAMPAFLQKEAFLQSVHQAKFKNVPDNYKALSPADIELIHRDPTSSPYLPPQEKGIRPACALPYELYADGTLGTDKKQFTIQCKAGNILFGKAASGSAFNVYAHGKHRDTTGNKMETNRNWSLTTSPGKPVSYHWNLNDFEQEQYQLTVYGPNGFYRMFSGNSNDPAIETTYGYELNKSGKATGNLLLQLHNKSAKNLEIYLRDNAYKQAAQTITLAANQTKKLVLDIARQFNWYDYSLTVKGNNLFQKRFAGHVETGRQSFTDPLMGQATHV